MVSLHQPCLKFNSGLKFLEIWLMLLGCRQSTNMHQPDIRCNTRQIWYSWWASASTVTTPVHQQLTSNSRRSKHQDDDGEVFRHSQSKSIWIMVGYFGRLVCRLCMIMSVLCSHGHFLRGQPPPLKPIGETGCGCLFLTWECGTSPPHQHIFSFIVVIIAKRWWFTIIALLLSSLPFTIIVVIKFGGFVNKSIYH